MIMKTQKTQVDNSGFTLIELMLAMTIMLLVMSAIYTTFQAQTRSWTTQQEIANMQQNLRVALYNLESSIRMAGYDPQNSRAFGFVSNFPMAPFSADGATTDADDIAFTVDADNDKTIDGNSNELVAYRLNPTTNELEVYDTTIQADGAWQTVAQNIRSVVFTYLDENNAVTTNLSNIRTVQITLTAKSGRASVTSTRSITSRVRCRNI
jgi:type IV pilus assembly protein PilW